MFNIINLIDYYNISTTQVILTICLLTIFFFIIFVVCSFFVFKVLQISFEFNNVFFYQYNKKCQKILDEYGECNINNIYIVRQPFGKFVNFIFNLLTLFNYNKYLLESKDNYPYHPGLIFEITDNNNNIKFLLVEKNNSINISETFLLHKNYEFKRINIHKKKFTLNKILKTTQKRIGTHNYFNWNIYENNCQKFTKEILLTLNKYSNKYNTFIFRDKIIKKYYSPSDFTLHIINCLFIINNFIEKYLLDYMIFY